MPIGRANVLTVQNNVKTQALLLTDSVLAYSTGPDNRPLTLEFMQGADNLSQNA
jgi:hypothetical protein